MDVMISERMTQAKEKDKRSLELFNQLLERRGPNVRIWLFHGSPPMLTSSFVQETSTLSDANGRMLMGHTDRQVDTEAQVAPTSCASSASALTHVPSPTRAELGERQRLLTDDGYPSSNPPSLTHCALLASISQKWPTAGSCSTSTTTPVPPAPSASRPPETRTHSSLSTTVTPATGIQQSSFVIAGLNGNRPLTAQERPESMPLPPSGLPPHFPAPLSSHPPPPSTHPDPPSSFLDVSSTVGSERQNGTTQRSSSSLLRSAEKKVSPLRGQTKIKGPTRASITQRQSAKFTPFSILPSPPAPLEAGREAPSRLMMPGAFPGTSLDDVDMSSWVLVSPVGPDFQVEVSNRNWFKRMFSRFG